MVVYLMTFPLFDINVHIKSSSREQDSTLFDNITQDTHAYNLCRVIQGSHGHGKVMENDVSHLIGNRKSSLVIISQQAYQ